MRGKVWIRLEMSEVPVDEATAFLEDCVAAAKRHNIELGKKVTHD